MHFCVAICLNVPMDVGETLMSTTKSEAKSEIFKSACCHVLESRVELQELVSDICSDIQYLVPYRNDLAHGRWFAPSTPGQLPVGMRGFKSTASKYDLTHIGQKIEEVSILTNKLGWLMFQTLTTLNPGLRIDGASQFEGKFQIGVRLNPIRKQGKGSVKKTDVTRSA